MFMYFAFNDAWFSVILLTMRTRTFKKNWPMNNLRSQSSKEEEEFKNEYEE